MSDLSSAGSDAPRAGQIVWEEFPELLDRPTLRRRLGLTRADIDRVFDRCEVYRLDGSRKAYVSREAVAEELNIEAPYWPARRRASG